MHHAATRSFENIYRGIKYTIGSNLFIERHRGDENAFTRQRIFTFQRLVMLLLNQLKGSLQAELDYFFQIFLPGALQRHATAAALSKARKKLKHTSFIELNEQALTSFYADFPLQKRWHGLRLLAVDGSRVELPNDPEISAKFGIHSTSGRPMGVLSTLYDLEHRLWLDGQLVPANTAEREVAKEHLAKTAPDDLLLYDRGYPSFWFFALHQQAERHFCMRLQRSLFPNSDSFFEANEPERIVQIAPTKPRRRQCRQHDAPTVPITLRLIRVVLDSGTVEVLATSLLDAKRYPAELFAGLYQKRWGIEEGYKHLKIHAELQNWSGRQMHTVLQDLHAKMLTLNLAAMHELVAQAKLEEITRNRQHSYQVNRAMGLSFLKGNLVRILTEVRPLAWIQRITDAMANHSNAIRPNRKFERKLRPGVGVRVKPAYKSSL